MERMIKRLGAIKQIDPEAHTFKFVANSGELDRSGEILDVAGCDYANWMANPVILWAHDDWGLPIGKGLGIEAVEGEGLVVESAWASAAYDRAAIVEALWSGGFLNGASVRFMPRKWMDYADGTPERLSGLYRRYTEWELLEISIVDIPCDPRALRKALDSGNRDELTRMVKMATDLTPATVPEATRGALEALGLATTDDLVTLLEPYLKQGVELGLGADALLAGLKEKLAIEVAADPDADAAKVLQEVLIGAADALHRGFVGTGR